MTRGKCGSNSCRAAPTAGAWLSLRQTTCRRTLWRVRRLSASGQPLREIRGDRRGERTAGAAPCARAAHCAQPLHALPASPAGRPISGPSRMSALDEHRRGTQLRAAPAPAPTSVASSSAGLAPSSCAAFGNVGCEQRHLRQQLRQRGAARRIEQLCAGGCAPAPDRAPPAPAGAASGDRAHDRSVRQHADLDGTGRAWRRPPRSARTTSSALSGWTWNTRVSVCTVTAVTAHRACT